MTRPFTVYPLPTGLIVPGDDIARIILESAGHNVPGGLKEEDIIVLAESAVATAEGRVVTLDSVRPDEEATRLAEKYDMDPRITQLVINESDSIIGGIPGFILSMTNGTLLPNAGIDSSNAPPGSVVLLPHDADGSSLSIRQSILEHTGKKTGVIIADSRTHAMRVGCSGVAIGVSGVRAIIDERGRVDLFGKVLHVTQRAIADNISSAAELVMGEADECIPAALVRGLDIETGDYYGIETMLPDECLFMGAVKRMGS